MGDFSVAQLATDIGLPVAFLLKQLKAAGVNKELESDSVSEKEKAQLVAYLRQKHTTTDASAPAKNPLTYLIERTKNAPSDLNKLSEYFLEIEVNYNSTVEKLKNEKLSIVGKLEDEKSRIQQAYTSTISIFQSKHEKSITTLEGDFENGTYVSPILERMGRSWTDKELSYFLMQWCSVAIGVVFLFFVKWYLGFLIGGLGFYIFNNLREKANSICSKLRALAKNLTFSSQNIKAISEESADIKEAIEAEAEKVQQAIEDLRRSLAEEYTTIKDKEFHELQQKLSALENKQQKLFADFEIKQQQVTSELNNNSNGNINEVKSILDLLVSDLNQLPETFDNNILVWKDESLLKAQEMVAYNLRIGQEMINIVTDCTHSIAVPRCIPFFNRSNIVINCMNPEETDRAIQITHNIIARTLLSLPASKIKITFIDPIKLGGNAAPFTPLIKEIYGGRVFTQVDDIETQLSILSRAIESIIQQYLQDKYPDIATYNLETKEVPEPYRLLVIYNFPHGFNDTSAKKLLNLISSGPRAGIHTILVNDRNAELPYGLGKSGWDAFGEGFSEIVLYKNVLVAGNDVSMDNPLVLLYGDKISSLHDLLPVLEQAAKAGYPILIIADDVDDQTLDTLSVNNIIGTLKNMVIKVQSFGNHKLSILEDIAFLSGGRPIGEKWGRSLAMVTLADLGRAKRIEVINGSTTLFGGAGKVGEIKARFSQIKKQLDEATSDYDRKNLLERKTMLELGVAAINIKAGEITKNKMVRGSEHEFGELDNKRFEFDRNLPFNEIVDFVNKEFPNVSSLKVPFTKYVAAKSDWWQGKAHKQFSVPIGRHGSKVQVLQFDNDDDNQALLIGKPGSGKSNLLHVIIANSLWKYSPDQLEIYLIDFKGGVEFTIYADKKIPHIRTIAIESEREFGLSVLDGVERVLLEREKVFSRSGVSNIEEHHVKFPDERMPRILLIVDEFQEFFTEDDNIKQAANEKFDRIIRKGRAFGINTLFSSQSLSGNSIQKNTRELIDIRIALMCSDTDATAILDERNPAARDLTRPGEGIYNAENGKVGGNKRFQAFFVEKGELHKTIEEVVAFAKSQPNQKTPFKQIIFRGSEKAHIEKEGHPLTNVNALANPKSITLWLGEPVAIADDVTATIRKQGGANLLVAGYDEGTGLRVMASSIISIAAQHPQDTAKFYYFNFFNVDSELVNVPHELFNNVQQQIENVGSRDVRNALQSIKEDIEKRLLEGASNNPNIYLAFFSFQRGRAFRKDGYTMSGEGDLLSFILKEGPDVGVFTMIQVDTMDNFSKNLDDNLLREFSQRVASQMNPDNSVKIIGNQKAAKLSDNRAWYYDDNENALTKFKPYELPSYSWVLQLQNKSSATLS